MTMLDRFKRGRERTFGAAHLGGRWLFWVLLILAQACFPSGANAQVIYDLAEIRGDVQIIGPIAYQFLNEIAVFDFNGNGQLDFFLGVDCHTEPNGIYGLFDVELHHNQILDLQAEPYNFWVHGDDGFGLGREVIGCDINADGIGDLAAYDFTSDRDVYIIFGSTEWASGSEINLSEEAADLRITGSNVVDIGQAMVSTDINADGLDDLIVGAPNARHPIGWSTGAVFVFFAGPQYVSPMTIDLDVDEADITIYGADGADDFGNSVAAGDVNGDGIEDLVVGAWTAEYSIDKHGRVYTFWGRQDWPDHHVVNLMQESADFTIIGPEHASGFGISVASDDFNGDGVDDVFSGAHFFDGGVPERGAGFVIHGQTQFKPHEVLDLRNEAADLSCWGERTWDNLGRGVSAGDLNGDGMAEMVIGALWDDDPSGTAYIVAGSDGYPPALTIDFSEHHPTGMVLGDVESALAVQEPELIDVNGDGLDDLILSSGWADMPDRINCGKIDIFFGRSPLDAPPRLLAGPGPDAGNRPEVRLYDPFAHWTWLLQLHPYLVQGYGTVVARADLEGGGYDHLVVGPGPGPYHPPLVTVYDREGELVTSFPAYGTMRYGVNLAAGDLDGDGVDEIVTGAGPGEVFGPHVRGWRYAAGSVAPMWDVSFMAYGTLRWGVNVACGDLDGDGVDEIVTGAGPGDVFGPHVRGWLLADGETRSISGVSYLAYGTNKYGVRVACGDIDGDGMDEIVTGPGPSERFGSHVRGWNYDGGALTSMNDVSYFAYDDVGSRGGVVVACGDIDNDGNDEILTTPGPLVDNLPLLKSWNYDGDAVSLIESKSFRLFQEAAYVAGANVAIGNLYEPPDFLP